jgi:hypothetical protein
MDPLERMMFGSAIGSLFILVPVLLICLAIPYAILRVRDARNATPDPQLGFKVAMHFFFSISLMLILTGLSVIVVDLLMPRSPRDFGPPMPRDSFPNEAQRTAFALILSGLFFGLLHFVCIVTLTTEPFTSPVRRTFLGCRFAVHGLVVMVAMTALLISVFQRDSGDFGGASYTRRFMLGVLLVWTPSWLVHVVLMRVRLPGSERERERERTWASPEPEPERGWER